MIPLAMIVTSSPSPKGVGLAEVEVGPIRIDDRHLGTAARRKTGPSCSIIVRVAAAADGPSAGTTTVKPGNEHARATSSIAICDGPSSPIEMPAWVPTSFTFWFGNATDIRIWSNAFDIRKVEKDAATGIFPHAGEARSDADHVRLCDPGVEEAVGVALHEVVREGRVVDVAIDHDDAFVTPELGERVAERLARGRPLVELNAREPEAHTDAPISARAAGSLSAGIGFPCHLPCSASRSETPLPLIVLAMIAWACPLVRPRPVERGPHLLERVPVDRSYGKPETSEFLARADREAVFLRPLRSAGSRCGR